MHRQCPKCHSFRVVRVGQYAKFVKVSLAGCVLLIAAAIAYPVFWIVLPFFLLISLWFYLSRPLLGCDDCNHLWNPRKPEQVLKYDR